MIGDSKELTTFIRPIGTIAIIDEGQSTINQALAKVIEQSNCRNINIIQFQSVTQYLERVHQLKEPSSERGLIDLKWIKTITSELPSSIIYIHYKNNSNTLESDAKIYKEIKRIRDEDKDIDISLFIVSQYLHQNYEKDGYENPYNLSNISHLRTNYIQSSDISKFSNYKNELISILSLSKRYYKCLKDDMKKNLKHKGLRKEDKVIYCIKLGYLSMLKSKNDKLNYKYFEEAYNTLASKDFNVQTYYYGSKDNLIFNFYQIRACADWLLFKIIQTNDNLIKNDIELINKCNKHLNIFLVNKYLNNVNPEQRQMLLLIDGYWKYMRMSLLIDIISNLKNQKKTETCIFYILKQIYSITRLFKYYFGLNDKQAMTVKVDNKEISIDKIILLKYNLYEKICEFEYQIDPLNKKKLPFSEEVILKKILNEIKDDPNVIRNTLHQKILICLESFRTDTKGIELYLHYINLLNDTFSNNPQFMNIDLKCVYSSCESASKSLIKFPRVYYNYLCQYNDFLISKYNSGELARYIDKLTIYNNLIRIGNHRVLTDKEEDVFFKLFSDEDLVSFKQYNEATPNPDIEQSEDQNIKELINVNNNNNENFQNNLFNFDYKIKGSNENTRKVLELVEYQFILSTCLSLGNMKLNYLEVFFANNKRTKKFSTFPNVLNCKMPINLEYKLFLKSNENNLMIDKVLFSFEGAPRLLYQINVYSSREKIILLEQISNKVLNFKLPTTIRAGENEFYHLECEVVKDPKYDVDIGSLTMTFSIENKNQLAKSNTMFSKSIKPTSMAASFEKMAGKPAPACAQNNNTLSSTMVSKPTSSMQNFFKNEASQNSLSKPALAPNQPTNPNSLTATLSSLSNSKNSNSTNKNNISSNTVVEPEPKKKRDPEFFILLDDGSLSEPQNKFDFHVDNFEEYGKNIISFLIRFKDKGRYTINYNASYTIVKREIDDDSIELEDKGSVIFETITPFSYCFEEYCSSYKSLEKMRKYNTNTDISIRMLLKNELMDDVIIKNISAVNEDDNEINAELSTPLSGILALDDEGLKDSLLTVLKSNEYILPFNCVFKENMEKKSFGKLSIDWTTEKLQRYSQNIMNNNIFTFPEVSIDSFCFDLFYDVGQYDRENNIIPMNIYVKNNAPSVKRIEVEVGESDLNFLIHGNIISRYFILPNQQIAVNLSLFPSSCGNLKLPIFKVREYDSSGTQKLYTIYYLSQNVNIEI